MIIKKLKPPPQPRVRDRVYDLINYITTAETGPKDEKTEKCLYYKAYNTFSQDRGRIKAEFAALQEAGHNVRWIREREFMTHWVMSFKGIERPEISDIEKACARFLEDMDLADHQAVMGVHVNTDNIHVHLAVSLINPATHTLAKNYHDIVDAHASLAGIEKALGAEPERNAMFSWNIMKGAVPNRRHAYISRKFAYASPEVVQVVLAPGMEKPDFDEIAETDPDGRKLVVCPALKAKGDCWFYGRERDACAIWDEKEHSVFFLNWNYRDTVRRILDLKRSSNNIFIIAQHEIAPYFVDGKKPDAAKREEMREMMASLFQSGDINVFSGESEIEVPGDRQVWARMRPPALKLPPMSWFTPGDPKAFYEKAKSRYKRKREPDIRLRSLTALTMAVHGFQRNDIRNCLERDGMNPVEAKSLVNWLYSPAGRTELYRQGKQGTLFMEKPKKRRPAAKKKKISVPRLRFGLSGEIIDASKRRLDMEDNAILWRLLKLRCGDMIDSMRKMRDGYAARNLSRKPDAGAKESPVQDIRPTLPRGLIK